MTYIYLQNHECAILHYCLDVVYNAVGWRPRAYRPWGARKVFEVVSSFSGRVADGEY